MLRHDAPFVPPLIPSVMNYGAIGDGITDDYAAFAAAHAALPAGGGIIFVPRNTGYKINTQITCTKPVTWKIDDTTITGPASGYLFDIGANNSSIIGSGATILKATNGCSGIIHNNQTQHCTYRDLILNLNSATSVSGLFHDGGWYLSASNIWIDAANQHATSVSYKIYSTNTGVAGPTGSYGGAYASVYSNCVGGQLRIDAGLPNKVTTMTFEGCDLKAIVAQNAVTLSFFGLVLQAASGNFFDLTNVAGLTCLGGDFEGAGTIYAFQGASNRDIVSQGNQLSGFSGTYMSGAPSAGSVFDDKALASAIDGPLQYGSLPEYRFRSAGWTPQHHVGVQQSGERLVFASNINLLSATTCNLDDVSAGGFIMWVNTSAQCILKYATAGANPRSLVSVAQFDDAGLTLTGALAMAGALSGVTTIANSGIQTNSNATDATSISTGASQNAGGASITKALWVGGLADIAGAATVHGLAIVDIGTGALPAAVAANTLRIATTDAVPPRIEIFGFGTTALNLRGRVSGGTRASLAATAASAAFLSMSGNGYDGSAWNDAGGWNFKANGLWSGSNRGSFHEWTGIVGGTTGSGVWLTLKDGTAITPIARAKGVTSTATAAGNTTLAYFSATEVQTFTGATTQTVTFPAANALGAGIGICYTINNQSSGTVTPTRAGSDTFQGGGTTDPVLAGATTHYISDGVSLWMKVGSA